MSSTEKVIGEMRARLDASLAPVGHAVIRDWIDGLSTPAAEQDDDTDDAISEVLHKLDSWCRAYPVDMFPEPEDADLKWLHATKPGLCDRISAHMGRHMVRHMREMADGIRKITGQLQARNAEQAAEIERVRGELDDRMHWRWRNRAELAETEAERLRAGIEGLVKDWRESAAYAGYSMDERIAFAECADELNGLREGK